MQDFQLNCIVKSYLMNQMKGVRNQDERTNNITHARTDDELV